MGEDMNAVQKRLELLAMRCEQAETRCLRAARRVQGIAVLAVAAVVVSAVIGARPPAHAGHPALEPRIAKLEWDMAKLKGEIDKERDARKAADALLQANIDAEVAARTAAVSDLQNQINNLGNANLRQDLDAEIARAKAAEATLQANLNAEIDARKAADEDTLVRAKSYTDGGISTEEQQRESADALIQQNLEEEARLRKFYDENGIRLANSYTDSEIAEEKQLRESGDAAALTSAKVYTDSAIAEEEQERKDGDALLQQQIDALGGGNGHESRIAALENKTQFITVSGNAMTVSVPGKILVTGTDCVTLKSGTATSELKLCPDLVTLDCDRLDAKCDIVKFDCTSQYEVNTKTVKTTCDDFDLDATNNCSIDAKTIDQSCEDASLIATERLTVEAKEGKWDVRIVEWNSERVDETVSVRKTSRIVDLDLLLDRLNLSAVDIKTECDTSETKTRVLAAYRCPVTLNTAYDGDNDPDKAEFAWFYPPRSSNAAATVRVHGGNFYLRNRLGIQNQADGSGNFCMGYGNNPNLVQSHSIVCGTGNAGTGAGNILWGNNNSATGLFSVIYGDQHFASGNNLCILGGKGNGVVGSFNTNAGGMSQTMSGTGASALGTFKSGGNNITVNRLFSPGPP